MARINTYQNDNTITGGDKVLGTDSNGAVTKNFRLGNIADWMSNEGHIGIAGQVNYVFQAVQSTTGRDLGSVSFQNFGGDLTSFSNVTELVFSRYNVKGGDTTPLIKEMVGNKIILARMDQMNNFGIFSFTSWTAHPTEPDFFVARLSHVASSGVLSDEKGIGFALYSVVGGDLNYTHIQSTSTAVWTITHNLGKRPSISVVDSAGTNVVGAVNYTSNNELTITFSSAFKGTAYLN